jgi:hypothetical protein
MVLYIKKGRPVGCTDNGDVCIFFVVTYGSKWLTHGNEL